MKLVEINWNPSARQLRQFAGIGLLALPLLGYFWTHNLTVVGWLAALAAVIALAGWFKPALIKPLFLGLTLIAAPIGMLLGELAMLLVYFGMFLPVGLVFRLLGRDELQLKADRGATTYWQPKKQPKDVASYYRQS